jgi:hypothetical protein
MGRTMFDVGLEPWGANPPFHMPVFDLTHRARQPLPMEGGTTYFFVTEGLENALVDDVCTRETKDKQQKLHYNIFYRNLFVGFNAMFLQILVLVFAVIGLVKGEFQLTRNRRLMNPHGRIAGGILLIGMFLSPLLGLIVAIIYGFATSTVEKPKNDATYESEAL